MSNALLPQILPSDARGRRLLVCTGGLRRLQEIPAEPGSAIAESVAVINCCFPKEIVRYYSPGFPDSLLDLIEDFDPLDPGQRDWSDAAPRPAAAATGSASASTTAGLAEVAQAAATASSSRTSLGETAAPPQAPLQAEPAALVPASGGALTRSCVSLATSASSRRCSASRCSTARRARKSRSRTTSRPRRSAVPEGAAVAPPSAPPQDEDAVA